MKILVINPNADELMSQKIDEGVAGALAEGTTVEVVNAEGAPPAIGSALDQAMCTPGTLARVREAQADGVDGVVIACYSDPGLAAAREIGEIPVVGIQEASLSLAAQLGRPVTVLTPGFGIPRNGYIEHFRGILGESFGSFRYLDVSVGDTVRDIDRVVERIAEVGEQAVREDSEPAIILGCGGLGYLAGRVQEMLGTPVIDPNAAGVKVVESLVALRRGSVVAAGR